MKWRGRPRPRFSDRYGLRGDSRPRLSGGAQRAAFLVPAKTGELALARPDGGVRAYGCIGLLQLRVLRLSFFQDRDIGVGVFPQCEEILIGPASTGIVPGQRACPP